MRKTPIKQGEELLTYIPQRAPFVMVDKIYEKGEDFLISGFSIVEGNVLVEEGLFKEGGLVENIAQTAALLAGTKFIDSGKEVPLGYIAGIKNLEVKNLPSAGTEVYTKTTITHDLMNIQVVEGEVFDENDQKIAGCELRIFIKGEE